MRGRNDGAMTTASPAIAIAHTSAGGKSSTRAPVAATTTNPTIVFTSVMSSAAAAATTGETPRASDITAIADSAQTLPGMYLPRLEMVQMRAASQNGSGCPHPLSTMRHVSMSSAYVTSTTRHDAASAIQSGVALASAAATSGHCCDNLIATNTSTAPVNSAEIQRRTVGLTMRTDPSTLRRPGGAIREVPRGVRRSSHPAIRLRGIPNRRSRTPRRD